MTYRDDIDGLRAVAVILVILSHVHLLPGGYIGVDVFFVISGFLIAPRVLHEMKNKSFSVKKFYTRRAKRLLPQAYAMISISFIIAYFLYLPSDLIAFSKSAVATVLYISNFYFLSQAGYFAPDAITQPLLHTWSLAVEEQFYFVAPLLLFALSKLKRPLLWLVIIGLISFAVSVKTVDLWTSANFYMLPFRAWEFIIGSMIFYSPSLPKSTRNSVSVIGIILILYSAFTLTDASLFPGLNAVAPVIGTTLLIWSGPQTFLAKGLSFYLVQLTGKASYSLYIWHWPIIVFYAYYSFGDFSFLVQSTMILATFIVGFFFWYVLEEPIRKSHFSATATFSATTGFAVLFGIAAFGVIQKDGLPLRLNEAAREMASTISEKSRYLFDCRRPIRDFSKADDIAGLCMLGSPSAKPTFALWGDSHAAALAFGVAEQAEKIGISGVLISVDSCPPIIGIDGWWNVSTENCRQTNNNVLEALRQLNIRYVFLHATWSALDDPEYVKVWADRFKQKGEPVMVALSEAINQTIDKLRENGITPIIIQDTPGGGTTSAQMLTRKLQTGSPVNLNIPRIRYEASQKTTGDIFKRIPGLEIINPGVLLCNNTSCEAIVRNKALHYDGSHLSETGARVVSDLLLSSLLKIKDSHPLDSSLIAQ